MLKLEQDALPSSSLIPQACTAGVCVRVCVRAGVCVCVCVCVHNERQVLFTARTSKDIWKYTHTHTHKHTCTCTHTHTHTHMHFTGETSEDADATANGVGVGLGLVARHTKSRGATPKAGGLGHVSGGLGSGGTGGGGLGTAGQGAKKSLYVPPDEGDDPAALSGVERGG
jgi:hypothetical protein